MKIRSAIVATAAAAITATVIAAPALADIPTTTTTFGRPAAVLNGPVIQAWTISNLKPSTDAIPYAPHGTLWEATATDTAVEGSVTPIVSNLNARAADGETYRVLFGVASPEGVNPSTIAQGNSTTGKIYFDVTGSAPNSVVYNDGDRDLAVWLPEAPAAGGAAAQGRATNRTPNAETPAGVTPPAGSSGTPVVPGSAGTPVAPGSAGTPAVGSTGTPLPAEGTTGTESTVAPATSAPARSSGTPVQESTAASTPAPAAATAPATTAAPAPATAPTSVVPQPNSETNSY